MATQVTLNSGSVDSAGSLLLKTNGTTTAVTIDTSQNVGIGTASPSAPLDVVSNSSAIGTRIRGRTSDSYGVLEFTNNGASAETARIAADTSGNIIFSNTGSVTERARIDSSGNLLVGTTGLGTIGTSSGFQITPSGSIYSASTGDSVFSRRSSNGIVITFRRDTTSVGDISVTTTTTAYNSYSDYRLKENIAPMTGALAKVAQLKPVTYKWKSDGSDGQGFIAHELQAVISDAVTGEKDAIEADGNPKYQGVDTSFLVATLTAAIQEQQALIESLTTRITALESK
jgi:hypothetical protein